MSSQAWFRAGLQAALRNSHGHVGTILALRGKTKPFHSRITSRASGLRIAVRSQSTSSSLPARTEYDEDDGPPKQQAKRPPRWWQRPVFWVLGIVPVLTFSLGVWQIQRLKWKMDLIDELERKLKREPLNLPINIDLEILLEHYTNRLFALPGRFPPPTPENTIFVGPRVRDGNLGYQVIQPLEREQGGDDVLVDRGFVLREKIVNYQGDPSTWRLADNAFDERSGSNAHLLLLPPRKIRNSFTPTNDKSRNVWHFADVDELVAHFSDTKNSQKHYSSDSTSADEQDSYTPSHGIAEGVQAMLGLQKKDKVKRRVLPIYMEEIFEGDVADASRFLSSGTPIGRAATVELRNQHAVYAATWFSLSAATSVMLIFLLRRAPKA